MCAQFEQCTYLSYVLLEAPREYVLHGPLLSIYSLRLCPHLGGPLPKPRHPEEVVYRLNDSCSHFTQRLFPPKVPQHIQRLFLTEHNNIIHTYYTSHSYTHLYLLFYTSYSKLHFFWSSWQTGCPWLVVPDTNTIAVFYKKMENWLSLCYIFLSRMEYYLLYCCVL